MRSVDGGHVACLHGRLPALRINAPPPRSTGLRRESRGSPRLRPRGRQPPNPQACFQGPPTPQALSSKTAPGPGFAETEQDSETRPSCAAGPSRDQSRHLSCGRDRGTPLLTPEWSGAREGSMQAHRPLWASQLPPAPPPTHDPSRQGPGNHGGCPATPSKACAGARPNLSPSCQEGLGHGVNVSWGRDRVALRGPQGPLPPPFHSTTCEHTHPGTWALRQKPNASHLRNRRAHFTPRPVHAHTRGHLGLRTSTRVRAFTLRHLPTHPPGPSGSLHGVHVVTRHRYAKPHASQTPTCPGEGSLCTPTPRRAREQACPRARAAHSGTLPAP